MSTLFTKDQLEKHLSDFRQILCDFDYSPIRNVSFFNLESFLIYMNTVDGNPFQKQYEALQKELDAIQPYLPFVSSKRAKDFLEELNTTTTDQEVEQIKKSYTHKMRQDFINVSRGITTEEQWRDIIELCEEIRLKKEEMLLALQ